MNTEQQAKIYLGNERSFGTIRRYYNAYDALYYLIFCWLNKAETRKRKKKKLAINSSHCSGQKILLGER